MLKKDYEIMAKYYDFLQQELDYNVWLNFYRENTTKNTHKVLEIGCGTGKFAQMLDLNEIEYHGFDLSQAMIKEAKAKNLAGDFFIADARSFELEQKFDVIICFMDTINYLTSENDLKKAFKQISKHLNSGGIVLFDIHREENLENFADYYELGYLDNLQYSWLSTITNERQKIVSHNFEFIEGQNHIKEIHKQKIESLEYYKKIVKKDFTIRAITDDEYRHYIVLVKE